jgi:catechol 2,3-dioxygenase-like lactoylglutathione lyase family enzyme
MSKLKVVATAHTGITVSNLERSVAFYRDILGFNVRTSIECQGDIYGQITGVPGAAMKIAYVEAPGHTLELLEYTGPADRGAAQNRPCDRGAMHIAFRVKDVEHVIRTIAEAGVIAVSPFVPAFPQGHRSHGLKAVYARDPDGVVIEFTEDLRIHD